MQTFPLHSRRLLLLTLLLTVTACTFLWSFDAIVGDAATAYLLAAGI